MSLQSYLKTSKSKVHQKGEVTTSAHQKLFTSYCFNIISNELLFRVGRGGGRDKSEHGSTINRNYSNRVDMKNKFLKSQQWKKNMLEVRHTFFE